MASHERIAGFAVIEFILRRGPANGVEILTVMFRVAARAIEFSPRSIEDAPVITGSRRDQVSNGAVAMHATELRRSRAEDVALCAFQWTIQLLVRG
jgi:hypothetical protein